MPRVIGFEIKMLDNMITREITTKITSEGDTMLSPTQVRIIKYLFNNLDKNVYQKDLEKEFMMRASTISGILKTMENNGIIEKRDEENDHRVKRIILKDNHIHKLDMIEKKTDDFQSKLIKDVSEEEIEIFFKVIDKMKENLSEEGRKYD